MILFVRRRFRQQSIRHSNQFYSIIHFSINKYLTIRGRLRRKQMRLIQRIQMVIHRRMKMVNTTNRNWNLKKNSIRICRWFRSESKTTKNRRNQWSFNWYSVDSRVKIVFAFWIEKINRWFFSWKRVTIIRAITRTGVRGDVFYYGPCGRKLRSFQEIDRVKNSSKLVDFLKIIVMFSIYRRRISKNSIDHILHLAQKFISDIFMSRKKELMAK